ncbi:MAG: DUF1232 domain-containing protein [Verrucomicrobiota bacterium]
MNPDKAVSIDEFLDTEVSKFRAEDLTGLRRHVDGLRSKMESEQARVHFDLVEGIELLIGLLQSSESENLADPLPKHLAEAGVAAAYILKGVDIIPDSIPEIGLTDDARILARVLERNPVLRGDV